ncbi:HNH endonuclease signature motif containing protein [Aestuariivita sp.]|jgi:5-methylcytosine-specific restriction protein A|uniref:HNH endonuclease n=1 Tax=Aestuariivita sp. TaxID=1872407 RepID=UPI0025BC36A1|nr:HNH endonuclease signature motif containing protein [Aestuariivita sp.]
MARISVPEIAACFEATRAVIAGELSKENARLQVNGRFGTSRGSVGLTIGVMRCMIEGRIYKRSVSEATVQYTLTRILEEDGPKALARGLASVSDHIAYYEQQRQTRRTGLRRLVERFENRLHLGDLRGYAEVQDDFQARIAAARTDSAASRRTRLNSAQNRPEREALVIHRYRRNPDVVAERLCLADGICDGCRRPAPFTTHADRPYLEVHHIVPLAENGDDTVENTLALCPNCHREAHFGRYSTRFHS